MGSDLARVWVMRGFGLSFIDLMVLLTEGRGGKFRPDGDGDVDIPAVR